MDRRRFLFLTPALLAAAAAGEWKPLFDGKSLQGWKETDFPLKGAVRVENGTIVLEKKYMTGVTWTGSFPKSNFEVRFEAVRIEGRDFFAGLTFPVAESHCSWIAGGWSGDVVGLSNIDGWDAGQNETTTHMEFETGRWYAFRLQVTDTRIQAWIGEEQVIDVDLQKHWVELRAGEIEASAPFGFASYETTAALRKIEYRLLAPAV
jgi:hypothetical protein